jgi:hypothetical protein
MSKRARHWAKWMNSTLSIFPFKFVWYYSLPHPVSTEYSLPFRYFGWNVRNTDLPIRATCLPLFYPPVSLFTQFYWIPRYVIFCVLPDVFLFSKSIIFVHVTFLTTWFIVLAISRGLRFNAFNVIPQMFNCVLIYLLTPWSRVLHENQIGSQLVKKFPHWNPRGHYRLTSVHHLSLSWAIWT